MQLTEQHIIGKSDQRWQAIDQVAWYSKNIYNAANYRVRQAYIKEGRYIPYAVLEKQFKQKDLLADQQLPMKVVQQVLRQVDHDWQAYFAARAQYKAHPDKFTGRPKLPGYKNTACGRNMLVYTRQATNKGIFRKKGVIKLSGLDVHIQTQQKAFDQVRILPRKTHYVVEVVYTVPQQPDEHLDSRLYAAGDLGVDTLLALTSNKPGFVPLLVNGRVLKSINQDYNQHHSALQSRLPEGQYTSHLLEALTDNRNRRIKTELHRCSKLIIQTLLTNHIATLVIGKNDGWKQQVSLGKRTNQNFVSIPHAQFIEMLTYKAALVGIQVIVTEEAYTSKCSFLDLEVICNHEHYAGKRVNRGLFRASSGHYINADVNASYNILRKVVPNAFADGIEAAVVQPVRVYPRAN
jgi:IS605 OrfB family transposase